MAVAKKVKWGILGAAKFGIRKVISSKRHGQFDEVDAKASRDVARANE